MALSILLRPSSSSSSSPMPAPPAWDCPARDAWVAARTRAPPVPPAANAGAAAASPVLGEGASPSAAGGSPLPPLPGRRPSMRSRLQLLARLRDVMTTFEAWIGTSNFSPLLFSLFMPSTEIVPRDGRTRDTRPAIPLYAPRSIFTVSPTPMRTDRRPYFERSSADRWPPTLALSACRGASSPNCLLRIFVGFIPATPPSRPGLPASATFRTPRRRRAPLCRSPSSPPRAWSARPHCPRTRPSSR